MTIKKAEDTHPMNGGNPDGSRTIGTTKVARLKRQIARRAYQVDPDAVAQEMLFKLRMISLGRSLLIDPRDAPPPTTTNPHPASE